MPQGEASARPHTPKHHSEHPMSKKLQPMTTAPKHHNVQKYCEFHEQNGHTTTECRELRKGLHELANKGKTDRFLKGRPRTLRRRVFHRDSGHHCERLCRGHHSVHLEGLAPRSAIGKKHRGGFFNSRRPHGLQSHIGAANFVRPTLHKAKVVIALYLLQPQFEADVRSVGKLQGDQ
ncbi:hypothetical protein Cgig2_020657 [Carnegiea gigantea]|uniref:Reverse transcriptase domain-containing protein n=1 Tax=Carnegiea gigantea TaxID=171969 RepID=A0A9Q1KHE7_9CARY|nr:hypothetical protein Cgig2_020657 [Carnegiea gigantea]